MKQKLIEFWRERNIVVDDAILKAFNEVPRELFVEQKYRDLAYLDRPLPTIRNQSISQPTTIMMMLQALELKEGHTVFEVGAGVGYQAALIAKIIGKGGRLITTEVIPELVEVAKENLNELDLNNAEVNEADGGEGYPDLLFDRIILTAACPTIPQKLIDQLKEEGIVVAPVGDLESQTMIKGTKSNGRLELDFLGSFIFVPMRGKHGFED